ncbi:MAG TPA: MerR family transcriptional regulator, partial [Longimicrobium sp.]
MFRIGEFAALTRVSRRMLRHYDAIGLLKPEAADPRTGYRYYSAAQLPRLNRILALRECGFSLDEVEHLLRSNLGADEIEPLLRQHRDELRRRIRADRQRLAQLRTWIAGASRGRGVAVSTVVVRSVAPALMATRRASVPGFGTAVEQLFDTTEAFVASHAARADSSPMLVLHSGLSARPMDLEVAIPLRRRIPPSPEVDVREMEGAEQMACIAYTGGYHQTELAFAAIAEWASARGLRMVGPAREAYVRFGADEEIARLLPPRFLAEHEGEYVTELQVPVDTTVPRRPPR